MNEFKSFFTSRTIWAALVALVPVITGLVGFDMGATLDNFLSIAGLVGVIYFRIKASTKLN